MNIWTNGCFDIIHTGHIELLNYAKMFNPDFEIFHTPLIVHNTLFVGLDSDERVKRLKGDKRPINDLNTRLTIMRNLRMVDEVFIFNTDDELRQLVKELNIDYMIIGDQYKDKEVIGHENSKYGVVYYPVDQRSTTDIIEKIINAGEKVNEKDKLNLVCFDIAYNNETIKIATQSYDIMGNMMLFGCYYPTPKFYEIEILEYIKNRFKGGVALDIGACIGNHSIYFSKFIFDKVFAFEVNEKNFIMCSENKKRNNISDDKLTIYHVALSDGNYNYLYEEFYGNMGGTKVTEKSGNFITKRLDDFELPKVDFIKIDVEGHELKVLKGAINLIKRDFPDIIVECNIYVESGFEIIDSFMKEMRYRLIQSFGGYEMYYYKHY